MGAGWSRWQRIDKFRFGGLWELGIYEIRIVKNRKPIPIERWGDVDLNGIACIGQGSLRQRLDHFYYAVIRKKSWPSHSAGILYFILKWRAKLNSKIGNHQLEFRYRLTKSKKEAKKLEALYLKRYLMKYCELPPLNSAIPSKVWEL